MYSQEWKSLRKYKRETGNNFLQDGDWLKKDRKYCTNVWKEANIFNLKQLKGNLKYKSISEIRDFYDWFDAAIKEKGLKLMGLELQE
jgi:hypothetical protein